MKRWRQSSGSSIGAMRAADSIRSEIHSVGIMFRWRAFTIACRRFLMPFFVISLCALGPAHGAGKKNSAPRESQADLKRETDDLIKGLAEHKAFLKEQIDQFVAAHPAAPGSDRDFPYDQMLYPIVDHVPGGAEQTSLCVSRNAASAELWCNAVAWPSVVRGDKLFVLPNETTQVYCGPRLEDADSNLAGDFMGVHTWRRSNDVLYLGETRFRIDPRPHSCKPSSWAWE